MESYLEDLEVEEKRRGEAEPRLRCHRGPAAPAALPVWPHTPTHGQTRHHRTRPDHATDLAYPSRPLKSHQQLFPPCLRNCKCQQLPALPIYG